MKYKVFITVHVSNWLQSEINKKKQSKRNMEKFPYNKEMNINYKTERKLPLLFNSRVVTSSV